MQRSDSNSAAPLSEHNDGYLVLIKKSNTSQNNVMTLKPAQNGMIDMWSISSVSKLLIDLLLEDQNLKPKTARTIPLLQKPVLHHLKLLFELSYLAC